MSRTDGDFYERFFEQLCQNRGFQVIWPEAANQHAWDLLVNGKKVQVKKRCVDSSKPNNIRLVTSRSSSEVVYATATVDVFAIYWRDDWYIVPASAIAKHDGSVGNGIHMPAIYAYRRRWDVLQGARIEHDTQTVMF